ncbi:MAG TPA: methyltransferase domain-containing protein [Kofleriaceae bacterium]|nr:methyltransferase domain-containing protein [Kofleriaceae bacterium]
MSADTWNPTVYDKFKQERAQPFHDLLALVRPVPGGRVLDLGCGSGELTALLHAATGAGETLGIDSSAAMLEPAAARARPGLRFAQGDIADLAPDGSWDVVFANASLQWLPDHPALLARLSGALRPGGQLAVQIPANFDHPTHTVADAIGAELGIRPLSRFEDILSPERYALLLDQLGFAEQHVRLQVYVHHLPATSAVIDWVQGSLLTLYRRELDAERFAEFLDRYTRRVLAALGDESGERPHTYPFKRVLMRARRP